MDKIRILTIRVPFSAIKKEDKTHVILNLGEDPVEKIRTVVQPVFEIIRDCNAFMDPTGTLDITGDPNLLEMKKGQRVELLACGLNEDAGYSPIRYTYITSKEERIETHAYIDNQNLKWISGNLGVRAGETPITEEE